MKSTIAAQITAARKEIKAVLSERAKKGYADYTKREIAYARYKVDGTYYENSVDRFEFFDDEPGRLDVWLVLNPPMDGEIIITEIQLFDTGGQMFLSQTEALKVDAVQEGLLYRITFRFKEQEES